MVPLIFDYHLWSVCQVPGMRLRLRIQRQISVINEFAVQCEEGLDKYHSTLQCWWHRAGETYLFRPNIKPNNPNSIFCQYCPFSVIYNAVHCSCKAKVLVFLQRRKKESNQNRIFTWEVDPFPKEVNYRKQRRKLFIPQ